MHVTDQAVGEITVVKLAGVLDAAAAPLAEARLRELTSAGAARFVLDLSELSYTASAGIRVFQALIRDARRRGGDVRLTGVQPAVQRILELVGLMPVLKTYDDLATALASF